MPDELKNRKLEKRVIAVCGPTASGKSRLADSLSEKHGTFAILVDSMQVYKEIPRITNQFREREARLAGIVSVCEEWSVADHVYAVEEEIEALGGEVVILDAGTGMYLNAAITNIPLAPKVPTLVRREAEASTKKEANPEEPNPRRASRAKELELVAGTDARGSIWDGELTRTTKLIYIKPDIETLEASIKKRSRTIVSSGIEEAERLFATMSDPRLEINRPVLDSIGVRELLSFVKGEMSISEAEERINIRTRQLAKRQTRWFDKLARTLEGRTEIRIISSASDGI